MANPPSGDQHGNVFRFPAGDRPIAGLASGGGGPQGPDMDARMTRLEEQFSRIETLLRGVDDRLRKVETDIAELKGRVANLPSTWAMVRRRPEIVEPLGVQTAFHVIPAKAGT